jgi:hypothetical protein
MLARLITMEELYQSALTQLEAQFDAALSIVFSAENQVLDSLGSISTVRLRAGDCLTKCGKPPDRKSLRACCERKDCQCATIAAIELAVAMARSYLGLVLALIQNRLRPDDTGKGQRIIDFLAEYVEASPERRTEMNQELARLAQALRNDEPRPTDLDPRACRM